MRSSTPGSRRCLMTVALALVSVLMASPRAEAGKRRSRGDGLPAPRILPGFSIPDRASLDTAFRLAAVKVHQSESCAALFDDLDFNGPEAFSRSYYQPASTARDLAICRKGAAVISGVRGRRVRICPSFKRHSPRNQVAFLIHETLHIAGLTEQPTDPNAMTPPEITRWVKKNCDL